MGWFFLCSSESLDLIELNRQIQVEGPVLGGQQEAIHL